MKSIEKDRAAGIVSDELAKCLARAGASPEGWAVVVRAANTSSLLIEAHRLRITLWHPSTVDERLSEKVGVFIAKTVAPLVPSTICVEVMTKSYDAEARYYPEGHPQRTECGAWSTGDLCGGCDRCLEMQSDHYGLEKAPVRARLASIFGTSNDSEPDRLKLLKDSYRLTYSPDLSNDDFAKLMKTRR